MKRNFFSPIPRSHVGENLWRLGCEPHYLLQKYCEHQGGKKDLSQNDYGRTVHASVVDAAIRRSFAVLKPMRFFVQCERLFHCFGLVFLGCKVAVYYA